jgi:hypothetical protein
MIKIEANFSKILSLRLKICLGDPDAISEANRIAAASGYPGYEEMIKDADQVLEKFSEEIGLTPYFITAFLVIDQAFKDFPEMADLFTKSHMMKNASLFKDLFGDRQSRAITRIKHIDNLERDPLPERPDIDASYDEWFDYLHRWKKLGEEIGLHDMIDLSDIAAAMYRSHGRVKIKHMEYIVSHDKEDQELKKT